MKQFLKWMLLWACLPIGEVMAASSESAPSSTFMPSFTQATKAVVEHLDFESQSIVLNGFRFTLATDLKIYNHENQLLDYTGLSTGMLIEYLTDPPQPTLKQGENPLASVTQIRLLSDIDPQTAHH